MGWCDDIRSKYYNKLINVKQKCRHEKLYRKDNKYDYLIVLDYNLKKLLKEKEVQFFYILQKNYKPTAGCIAIKRFDFEILLKLINSNTLIKI